MMAAATTQLPILIVKSHLFDVIYGGVGTISVRTMANGKSSGRS